MSDEFAHRLPLNQIHKVNPAVVVIDSIQMIYKPEVPAAPGSVTQLRDCCMDLVYLAKLTGVAVIFVGHVTKAGTLAGPKTSCGDCGGKSRVRA